MSALVILKSRSSIHYLSTVRIPRTDHIRLSRKQDCVSVDDGVAMVGDVGNGVGDGDGGDGDGDGGVDGGHYKD